ncbi:MAG: hypothetical protein ACQEWD_05310 [Bacteroidota bacterium]
MRTISKTLILIGIMGAFVSCKSSFDATETMELQNNRNAVYQEIISNPGQLNEFIELAQQDEEARRIMMQSQMQMMESARMKEMMENNPDMKERVNSHMQKMMEKNPEMQGKMQSMMIEKMLKSPEGRKMLMEKIHKNTEMKKDMMKKMMDNPEMMEGMMEKMMDNPEMKKKMKSKMKEENSNSEK